MDTDADPALQFFPDGEVDLYAALQVEKEASAEEIKKAYRKMALRYHPDKVLSATSTSSIDPHQKFQQIGFAYSVLSDEARRKRYDATGRTNESMFEQDGFSWDDYFKEMWQGSVSGEKLDEFKKKYQHSEEEKADVLEAYETSKGDLATIFTLVPCSEILEDEDRFVSLISSAIKSGQVKELPRWKQTTGDAKGRKKMREGARKEAQEAEEYAKELGVWDDLYGKGRKAGSNGQKGAGKKQRKPTAKDEEVEVVGEVSSDEEEGGDDGEEEEDDEPIQAKKRSKKPPPPSSSKTKKTPSSSASASTAAAKAKKSSKRSKAEADGEEEDDMEGLRALMAKRGEERNRGFNSMIARMEAQAQAEATAKGRKKGSSGGGRPMFDEPQRGEDEPDEEAFLKAREKIDARKRSKEEEKERSKGGGGASSSSKKSKTR